METDSGQIAIILLLIETDASLCCGVCFLLLLKNVFLLNWNRYDVWYSDNKPVKV